MLEMVFLNLLAFVKGETILKKKISARIKNYSTDYHVNFVLPDLNRYGKYAENFDDINIDENQALFSRARETLILQTYLILSKENTWKVYVNEKPIIGSINIILNPDIREISLSEEIFCVGVRADKPKSKLVDCEIVQNPRTTNKKSFYIPLWPQPNLKPRNTRRTIVKNIAYAGVVTPQLLIILRKLEEDIAKVGLSLKILDHKNCDDLSEIDILLAVRDFSGNPEYHKPPSKLVNAWLAGIPLIATPESAFKAVGLSGTDYIEVYDQTSLKNAVLALSNNEDLYKKLVNNGKNKAAKYSREVLAKKWIQTIEEKIYPIYINKRNKHYLIRKINWYYSIVSDLSYKVIKKFGRFILNPKILISKIRVVIRKGRVNFFTKNYHYTIYYGNSTRLRKTLILANTKTKEELPWSRLNCNNSMPLFVSSIFSVLREKRFYGGLLDRNMLAEYIETLVKYIPLINEKKHWIDTFNKSYLNSIFLDLTENERDFIYETLRGIYLPVSGAHGNFNYKNLLKCDKNLVYINDWECFRENGSCVEDLCSLILSQEVYLSPFLFKERNRVFSSSCIIALDNKSFKVLGDKIGITEIQAAMIGALSRLHLGIINPRNLDLEKLNFKEIIKELNYRVKL
jgi:hypothetical protein